MSTIADLHLHSKYSRATSKKMDIQHMSRGAKRKGIDLLGTSDFAHPKWFNHLKNNLAPTENKGIYDYDGIKFIFTNEISLMYKQDRKIRKIHLLLLSPSMEVTEQINDYLGSKGKVDYDGRPIFGIACSELVENLKNISKDVEIIPAHILTPWFGIFGSKSGFDSVQECFQDKTKHVHALETGLSSDPAMDRLISNIDNYQLVSFSDSHSPYPWRIGRECTIFDFDKLRYDNVIKSIRTGNGLKGTVEVNPKYGKYHLDGHRNCNVSMNPKETKNNNGLCPKCKKPLTIGVMNRVCELADRKMGYKPNNAKPFETLLPLHELISTVLDMSLNTKTVKKKANGFLELDNELNILMNVKKEKLINIDSKIASAILRIRNNNYTIEPGYDGKYGKLKLKEKKVSDFF